VLIGWVEIALWVVAGILLVAGSVPVWRAYRSLLFASAAMLLISSVYPNPDNALGTYLFGSGSHSTRLPTEFFGIAWWLIGAWVLNGLLDIILRRTLFPRDNEPHARRLFADLASVLFYVVAFVGIMETVLKQPISAVLATSGVLAIVVGLALQNTLGDVFSGLAINVDRPFGAGDWITLDSGAEGQVLEINWRATRLRTWQNDVVVIPNSVVAKAVVSNHSRRPHDHYGVFALTSDSGRAPAMIIELIAGAANGDARGRSVTGAYAYASDFGDSIVTYQVVFALRDFAERALIQSELITRIGAALIAASIDVGSAPTRVQVLRRATPAASARTAQVL
jgi:small-conductance mechanosensitive channel